jgi:hypothetical protein
MNQESRKKGKIYLEAMKPGKSFFFVFLLVIPFPGFLVSRFSLLCFLPILNAPRVVSGTIGRACKICAPRAVNRFSQSMTSSVFGNLNAKCIQV